MFMAQPQNFPQVTVSPDLWKFLSFVQQFGALSKNYMLIFTCTMMIRHSD